MMEYNCSLSTPAAAAAVRSSLMASGYILSGFPDDYDDNGNGSTAPLLESRVHHVECYSPRNSNTFRDDVIDQDEALRFGAWVDDYASAGVPMHPLAFTNTPQHKIKCLPDQELLFNFKFKSSKSLDVIVGEVGCEDARELLESFDIIICKCSFDGRVFRIPNPHLTFNGQTVRNPLAFSFH